MPKEEGDMFLNNALKAYKVSMKLKKILNKEFHRINLTNDKQTVAERKLRSRKPKNITIMG